MRPKSQKTENLVTFTEEILNSKLHFLRSETPIYTEEDYEHEFAKKIAELFFLFHLELSKPSPKRSHLI